MISGVPEETAKLGITVTPTDGWSIYADAQYIGNAYLSGDNQNQQDETAGYTVFNTNIRYAGGPVTYSLRVSNLTNKLYSESVNAFGSRNPSPERRFLLKAEYTF